MNGIQEVISKLEAQRSAIERALAALHEVDGIGETPSRRGPGRPPKTAVAAEPAKKADRRGTVTPEGRRRLAEAMKRRWAVKRAAAAVNQSPAKKKAAAKKTVRPAAA